MDLGWQVLRCGLDKLTLVSDGAPFFVEQERRAEVDDFQRADRLCFRVVINDDVVRFQVSMDD